jgi:hypothetical protein
MPAESTSSEAISERFTFTENPCLPFLTLLYPILTQAWLQMMESSKAESRQNNGPNGLLI